MGSNSSQDRILSHSQSLVRRKSRSLIGRYGIIPADLDGLKQDLMFDILCRAERYDPDRGSEIQYVSTLVRHGIARIVERRQAEKRGAGFSHVSLDAELETKGGESVSLHEIVDKQTYLGITRCSVDPNVDRLEAKMDLELVTNDLLPDQCELLTLLLSHTPSEAARELGIPRTTLNSHIANLLSHLRKTKK